MESSPKSRSHSPKLVHSEREDNSSLQSSSSVKENNSKIRSIPSPKTSQPRKTTKTRETMRTTSQRTELKKVELHRFNSEDFDLKERRHSRNTSHLDKSSTDTTHNEVLLEPSSKTPSRKDKSSSPKKERTVSVSVTEESAEKKLAKYSSENNDQPRSQKRRNTKDGLPGMKSSMTKSPKGGKKSSRVVSPVALPKLKTSVDGRHKSILVQSTRTGLQPLAAKLRSLQPFEWDIPQFAEFKEIPFKKLPTISFQVLSLAPLNTTFVSDERDNSLTDEQLAEISSSVFQLSPQHKEMKHARETNSKLLCLDLNVTSNQSPFILTTESKKYVDKKKLVSKRLMKE